MKKFVFVLAGLAMSSIALAAPSTYLELAYITGGENNNRVDGEANGFEFAGSWGINENWYAGGVVGSFENDANAGNDIDNDYINVNGGYVQSLNDKTSAFAEAGLWLGEESEAGEPDRDPRALEAKVGLTSMISDKISVFGTFSLVEGDTDKADDDLSNFIWSLGGSYSFTDKISANVKLVNGVNGVNGQDEVLRIGGRWTF